MTPPNVPPMPPGTPAPTGPVGAPQTQGTPAPAGAPTPSAGANTQQRKTIPAGKVNYTSKQLFEVSGAVDVSRQFPEAIAFVMFVPGIPDETKATGVTYDQSAKEIMKINIRDLYGMAEALNIAAYGNQTDFIVYTDSSKFAGNQGQGVTKQVSINSGDWNGKLRVYINYKGQGQIRLSIDKWHALGLSAQLKALADETLRKKFKEETSYNRG